MTVEIKFDYGNLEDKKLILEMLGGPTKGKAEGTIAIIPKKPKAKKEEPVVEKVEAEKPKAKKKEPVVEKPEAPKAEKPAGKEWTAQTATPLIAGYCQDHGPEKPKALIASFNAGNISELTSTQIGSIMADLGLEG